MHFCYLCRRTKANTIQIKIHQQNENKNSLQNVVDSNKKIVKLNCHLNGILQQNSIKIKI